MSNVDIEASDGVAVVSNPLVHHRIEDIERLRAALQTAIEIEFTIIPAYLFSLFTITDKSSAAFQTLRSVVVEEMFHVNQAANLLIGVGGQPRFTGTAVPKYPCYPPAANKATMPLVGLYQASPTVFRQVFMRLEAPAPYSAAAEGEHYATVSQFYKAIEAGLEACVEKHGAAAVFRQAPSLRQRGDIYIGKFGGPIIEVRDLSGARQAILEIVQQGEGAVDPIRTLAPLEPWGSYNHYGARQDGTYGPIMGTPFELSHYFRFKRAVDADAFPDVYPTMSNPRLADFSSALAKHLAITFNECYSVMLLSLEKSFQVNVHYRDVYFEVTLPLMHNFLPRIAELLVTTPASSESDASVGPNAAPTFEYHAGARLHDVHLAAQSFGSQIDASHKDAGLSYVVDRERRFAIRQLLDDLGEFHRFAQDRAFDL